VKNWNVYYCFQRLKILTRIQSIVCIQGKFRHRAEKRWEDKTNIVRTLQGAEKRQKDKTDAALSSRIEKRLQEKTSKL